MRRRTGEHCLPLKKHTTFRFFAATCFEFATFFILIGKLVGDSSNVFSRLLFKNRVWEEKRVNCETCTGPTAPIDQTRQRSYTTAIAGLGLALQSFTEVPSTLFNKLGNCTFCLRHIGSIEQIFFLLSLLSFSFIFFWGGERGYCPNSLFPRAPP